ncbi:MAG: lysozyme [Sphingomonas phyllosphaerae]|uniref:lysozyme n=1 Tax=Sphingomonas phyllosphaerae TaxID=257003 RepID=UPI002FF7D0A5
MIDALADAFGIPREGDGALTVALKLIKQFEGCELEAYPDPGTGGAPWTIGWGATSAGIVKGVRWTQAQADERLASDVAKFMSAVVKAAPVATDNQRGAMTSLAYNIGEQAFRDSTLLKLHNAGNYVAAAEQFGRWNKAGGRILAGLTKRRAAEASVYRS